MVSSLALATFACGVLIGIDDRSLDDQADGGDGRTDGSVESSSPSDATSETTDAPIVEAGCPAVCTRCAENRCIIDCGGAVPCPKTVVCPPGLACRVLCESDAGKTCDGRTVDCTQATSCRVDCNGVKDTCDEVKILAAGNPLCITCKGADAACDKITCATSATCTRICAGGVGGSCTTDTCPNTCVGGSACP